MKNKLSSALILAFLFLILLYPAQSSATVTCTQAPLQYGDNAYVITLTCSGTTGTITFDAESAAFALGKRFTGLSAYGGSTLPTADSDVTFLVGTEDLLGGKGTNLLTNSTVPKETPPYNATPALYVLHKRITGTPSIVITNQAVDNADMIFKAYFED